MFLLAKVQKPFGLFIFAAIPGCLMTLMGHTPVVAVHSLLVAALAEIVREEMFAGRAVDLADLGSFKVVSIGKRVMTEKEVTADTLKAPRIQFFPKMEMRNQTKSIQRIVLRSGESVPEQPGTTPTPGETPSPTPENPLG